jgi:hypothetical protein
VGITQPAEGQPVGMRPPTRGTQLQRFRVQLPAVTPAAQMEGGGSGTGVG